MYWHGNRSSERFTFRRVTWPGWEEADEYDQITGGSLELSAFSDIKAVGSLDFDGAAVPDDRDLVRIYYGFTDDFLDSISVPLATLFFSVSEPAYDGNTVSGTMECSSVLQVLANKVYGLPFTATAGTRPVKLAIELCESLGLKVNNPDPSAYTIKNDHTFDSDASYLEIVNWLLGSAGFSSCWPDAYGVVQMCEYREPLERPSSVKFSDGDESVMLPEVSRRSDYQSTPNVVRMSYETEDESLWASASNIDPDSRASVVSRRQENTRYESVSELDGDTVDKRLANLKAAALSNLVDNSSDIEYVTMTHAWLPIAPNDAVEIDYIAAGLLWSGAVTNLAIDLEDGVPCQLTARRFVRTGIKTETKGGVLWHA